MNKSFSKKKLIVLFLITNVLKKSGKIFTMVK